MSITPDPIDPEPSTSSAVINQEPDNIIEIPEPPNLESNQLIASLVDTVDAYTTRAITPTDEDNVSSSQDVNYRTLQQVLDVSNI